MQVKCIEHMEKKILFYLEMFQYNLEYHLPIAVTEGLSLYTSIEVRQ